MPPTSSRTRGTPVFLPRDQWPNIEHLVTEDDTPVDGIFSEKQMRLLVEALYSSWTPGRDFIAMSNVGLFFSPDEDPLVPDVLLSMDVVWYSEGKESNSYFTWVYGKCPDVVVEVVSNRKGGEFTRKLKAYAKLGIPCRETPMPEKRRSGCRKSASASASGTAATKG